MVLEILYLAKTKDKNYLVQRRHLLELDVESKHEPLYKIYRICDGFLRENVEGYIDILSVTWKAEMVRHCVGEE